MSEYKRPKFLSIMIGVEMIRFMTNFIYTLVISFTNTNILSISLIFNFLVWVVSLSGMWMMKKWSVIIYITVQVYFLYGALMAGNNAPLDYLEFIFPAILIYLGFKNYKYMS